MRPLAEFIMRGRLQATTVALAGSLLPLITPATVALVTLRKGAQEGTLVLIAGLIPPLATYMVGDVKPLMASVSLFGLIVVYIASLALRSSMSWAHTLLVLIVSTIAAIVLTIQVAPDPINALVEALKNMLSDVQRTSEGGGTAVGDIELSMTTVSGFLANIMLFNGFFALLLGRWWQAQLYNPGGFGEEFRELRLGVLAASASFAATMFCLTQGTGYQWWANAVALPLVAVGAAIVHSFAKAKSIGLPWVILFYIAMIGFSPVLLMVIFLGFIDTWLNFRSRFTQQ